MIRYKHIQFVFIIVIVMYIYTKVFHFRNLLHITTTFNLPNAYNLPRQENISDEDDKKKVSVEPKIELIKELSTNQIEDIVKGWIRHIRKILKSYENKVAFS